MKNFLNNKTHQQEIEDGARFSFGANWAHFLSLLNESRIQEAVDSLGKMLDTNTNGLEGKTFLDIGSGSGLFSLAARRLGARVTSFDYDPQSVACTQELKRRYFPEDRDWDIQQGSVLDIDYIQSLGKFDIVYSWGVLHHTGSMWDALANVDAVVLPHGKLFIALYNYQPFASQYWVFIKKTYNKFAFARPIFILMYLLYPLLPSVLIRKIQGRKLGRGMSDWYDMIDWLGGYPFEVAKPELIFDYYKKRGYQLLALRTVGGRLGCNEFVFQRVG